MTHPALILFLALFGLYSPVAALASYLPIVRPYTHKQVNRLAIGLGVNVAVFVLAALWIGEPLLKLLGISTAALTATGGIALAYAAIPLMRGQAGAVEELERLDEERQPGATPSSEPVPEPKSVLFTPLSFPLTVGGTTFAFCVAASAAATTLQDKLALSLAVLCFAVVTGVTLYLSGHVQRRISLKGAMILDRVAGILLTAIAVILLANGFTDLVTARLAH
ncbi:MarC family protein [Nonomuraea sp. 3-1Str]|uniref:MarC family protein n=1 Tax=Nonomuraea sp. 3-1Str TaxID=2929801 RepID=UPI00285D4754|nr:MarC family protein [Nonomuraea sp. 3-1Str]MDR8408736.1 MarC family protein [Nonomuraea sp. 3-1Str]